MRCTERPLTATSTMQNNHTHNYVGHTCTGSLVYLLSAYRKFRVSVFNISGCESKLPVLFTLLGSIE